MPHDSRLKSRPISRSFKPARKQNNPQKTLRAFLSGRHLTCTIPWLIQKTQGPVTPSTALSTKGSFVLFPSAGLSNPVRYHVGSKVVRTIKSEYAESFRLWNTPMPIDGRSHKPRRETNAQTALQALFFWPETHVSSITRRPTCTIPHLIKKSRGPVIPSTALSTKSSSVLFPPGGPSSPMLCHVARKVVRMAVSVLCKEMLQPGQCAGLGSHEMEEIEIRLRALARFKPIWGKSKYGISGSSTQLGPLAILRDRDASASALGEEMERKLFAGALRDGYILCQWVSSSTSFRRIHVFWGRNANGILSSFFFCSLDL